MKKHFEKIKSEGTCIHRLDEELIRRRREELRSANLSPLPLPTSRSLDIGRNASYESPVCFLLTFHLCLLLLCSLKVSLRVSSPVESKRVSLVAVESRMMLPVSRESEER